MPIICPLDGKDDSVQSIHALIAGGTITGSFSGNNYSMSFGDGGKQYSSGISSMKGTFVSTLSQSLAKPQPPKVMGVPAIFAWSALMFISMGLGIVFGPILVWRGFKNSVVANPSDQKRVFTSQVSAAMIFMLIIGWYPIFIPFLFIVKNMIISRMDYPRRFEKWNEACKTWNRLYYCHRCGIVFDPMSGQHFQPDHINGYLRLNEYK